MDNANKYLQVAALEKFMRHPPPPVARRRKEWVISNLAYGITSIALIIHSPPPDALVHGLDCVYAS